MITPNILINRGVNITEYIFGWLRNLSGVGATPLLPTILNLPITERCNSRCAMCGVWSNNSNAEFSADELYHILRGRLFKSIRYVGISGGEPTLRKDLFEVCRTVIETLPQLRGFSITSNGFNSQCLAESLSQLKRLTDKKKVDFSLNLSLDGIAEVHDRVRGIKNAFNHVKTSINIAQKSGVFVQLQCTVSNLNVYSVGNVLNFAKDIGVDCVFRLATIIERLDNKDCMGEISLNNHQRSFFADFLESSDVIFAARSLGRRLLYHDLSNRLKQGLDRKAPCYFQNQGVFLSPCGDLFHCSMCSSRICNALKSDSFESYFSEHSNHLRKKMLANTCRLCVHDQSGIWSPLKMISVTGAGQMTREIQRKIFVGMRYYGLGPILLLKTLKNNGYKEGYNTVSDLNAPRYLSALMIGCYGGEHVGDAAILGGVIQRMQKEFHTENIIVASLRPDRTKRWAESLKMDVTFKIIPYSKRSIRNAIASVDCLVIAGGPLMDLPDLLVRHLYTALEARKSGAPIIVESIGVGPLNFSLCRSIAIHILRMASRVRVRTAASSDLASGFGIKTAIVRDPAFDYLETYLKTGFVAEHPPSSLKKLLQTTRPIIAVNLRPLWIRYAAKSHKSINIKNMETEFLNHFASAMETCVSKVRFIFFPMNADQYGFSDLCIAYSLQKNFHLILIFTSGNMNPMLRMWFISY